MRECKSVGPNLKTYFYYINEAATKPDVKGVIILAHGIEGTGAVYNELGEYLDSKGYALYAIDELGYGKTGKVTKETYKNWKRKSFHFASYCLHALSVLAKGRHPNAPVYLVANDFGAMLSLYLIREFPEVVDKVVTIGWGMPRLQDYGFLCTSTLRKIFFFDGGASKGAHFGKNKSLAIRFETDSKYSWLTSDKGELNKLLEAGFLDTPGTVGHYFFYYVNKIRVPLFMRMKKTDRNTPLLFVSGDKDLLTLRGRKTKELAAYYRTRKFTNVTSLILEGRHELLFEKNRFENVNKILEWLENDSISENITVVEEKKPEVEVVGEKVIYSEVVEKVPEDKIENVDIVENVDIFQEADEELLISTNKEDE